MTVTNPLKPRCHAHNRQGQQCGNLSVPGARVCRMHGGLIPRVQIAAAERIKRMVPSALDTLEDLLSEDQPAAARYASAKDILDRAGYKPTEKLQTEQQLTIRVVREDQPIIEITPQRYDLGNGRTHD